MKQKILTSIGNKLASIWGKEKGKEEERSIVQKKLNSGLLNAAEDGRISEVRRLLKMGADKHAKDEHGRSAFSLASKNRHSKTMRVLLQAIDEE